VFFPLARHARPPHQVIHELGRIRPPGIKENKYQIGTLPNTGEGYPPTGRITLLLSCIRNTWGCSFLCPHGEFATPPYSLVRPLFPVA
jgi:hypothetical protein